MESTRSESKVKEPRRSNQEKGYADYLVRSFLCSFVWLVVTVKNRRKFIAVTLTGVLVMTLGGSATACARPIRNPWRNSGGPQCDQRADPDRIGSINTVRTAVNNLQQVVAWPQQLINQAKAQVTQMIGQYRTLMSNIFRVNLNSATLPTPQALEAVIRDHQVNNFSSLTTDLWQHLRAHPGCDRRHSNGSRHVRHG